MKNNNVIILRFRFLFDFMKKKRNFLGKKLWSSYRPMSAINQDNYLYCRIHYNNDTYTDFKLYESHIDCEDKIIASKLENILKLMILS